MELVSFIDMIFILLVFFLLTNFSVSTSMEEKELFIPTPKNVLGRSQIVLQMIDRSRVLWLDDKASQIVSDVEDQVGYFSSERLNEAIMAALVENSTILREQLPAQLQSLVRQADQNPQAVYFVLLRVPNEMPYYLVVDVISTLSTAQYQNIRYGCVAGTLDELKQAREIKTVLVEDKQGNRKKNLRIDF